MKKIYGKKIISILLATACIGIALSECAVDVSVVNESTETPETSLNS